MSSILTLTKPIVLNWKFYFSVNATQTLNLLPFLLVSYLFILLIVINETIWHAL